MKKLITFLLAVALTSMVSANNITVTNILLTGQNTASDYSMVQFNLSWENSWRTSSAPTNWDAAWVFVKYRVTVVNGGDGLWHHASLNNTGHTAPSGSTIDIGLLTPATDFNASTNPGLGAFIYRSANGTGTNAFTGAQLRWNYGVNYSTGSTPIGDNDIIDVQVFAIEMVYVTSGNFYAGDGTTNIVEGQFNDYNSTAAFQITSESVPTTLGGNTSGNMRNNNTTGMITVDDFNNSTSKSLPTVFPKGYNSFYCMKYEISQQGYVDFLNSLTQDQATNRKYSGTSSRYAITGIIIGSYVTTNPYVACNFLGWADVVAYLDWSGLRPMTELEYEKACRGPASPSADECAWGNGTIYATRYEFSGSTAGTSNEVVSNPASGTTGNTNYFNTRPLTSSGPLRVGSFALSGSNRIAAGATYYGIMEMSGNLAEFIVTVGNSTGRTFTGNHGNGALNSNGDADATSWPNSSNALGTGLRGSSWNLGASYLRVSDRWLANYLLPGPPYPVRAADGGGRGVRGAPSLFIGQSYAGGIIFYIDGTGLHGLIAAVSDQSSGIAWITGGSTQSTLNGNTLTALGTGQANTNFMMAQTDYTGGAAQVCDDYTNTETGTGVYSDWYLPSKDELNKLYLNNAVVGGFVTNNDYWSSSEDIYYVAWVQYLTTGGQAGNNKTALNPVRAIRSF